MHLVSPFCIPVSSSISTSLSFFKVFVLVSLISTHAFTHIHLIIKYSTEQIILEKIVVKVGGASNLCMGGENMCQKIYIKWPLAKKTKSI